MAEKKKRLFDLPETKGSFQLKGIVSGVKKDDFYKQGKTTTNKAKRSVKFRVEYEENNSILTTLNGIERDLVYFSKRKDDGSFETETVQWGNRFEFNKDGFRLMGCNIGVKKKLDENGKEINDKGMFTEFDACKEIGENLKDGQSVFIRGDINHNSFIDDNGEKKAYIKLSPNQVSLCSPVDFNDEKYVPAHDFRQTIIFTGIEKEKDDNNKITGRFTVSAKIVTYNTIEDAEFIITDENLANLFRKKLKPYNAIDVHGKIITTTPTEIIDEDNWGEADAMERVTAPSKTEFLITGAKGSTLERELYTEEKIEQAMSAIAASKKVDNDFGKSDSSSDDDWGIDSSFDDDEDVWE